MSKTIYLICHTEFDGDLRVWEVHDEIAFLSKDIALEYINKKNKKCKCHDDEFYITEIDLIDNAEVKAD